MTGLRPPRVYSKTLPQRNEGTFSEHVAIFSEAFLQKKQKTDTLYVVLLSVIIPNGIQIAVCFFLFVYLLFFFFFFPEIGSHVAQASLKLTTQLKMTLNFLFHSEGQSNRCLPSLFFLFAALGTELRALQMLAQQPTNGATFPALTIYF